MTPEKKPKTQQSIEKTVLQRGQTALCLHDSINEDKRALKTSNKVHHCERNNGFAIHYCYLRLTMLQLLGKIMTDDIS